MPIDLEPFKKWFGYNRKERRASYILLILVILVLLIRMAVPEKNMDVEDLTIHLAGAVYNEDTVKESLFSFDPNTASYDTLLLLGLEEKEARTLISYRNKGGRFRKPSDIHRLYGLDSGKAERLTHVIQITQPDSYNIRYDQPHPINLNRCDSAELVKLPGIGPVLSARIIKYRKLLGGYAQRDQLKEVYGLTPETYDLIKNRVFADTGAINRININSSDYRQLSQIPYLRRYQVTDILKYRELMGKISNLPELVHNNLIADSTADRIKAYIVF